MSTCKITYNGNEISAVDETAPVSVAYNSATIATLNDGDTKTLGCHGKVMTSDVVIGSKTLNCNGKLMQGDIVVELVGSTTSGETWQINDVIDVQTAFNGKVNFMSNNIQFAEIRSGGPPFNKMLLYDLPDEDGDGYYESRTAYSTSSGWNNGYNIITLEEPASGRLLTWLQANATKIS